MKKLNFFFIIYFFILTICGFAQKLYTNNPQPIYPELSIEFGDIKPKTDMYVATNMDKIFVHYEVDSNSNLTAITIGNRSEGSIGENSVVIGNSNNASGNNSIAIGQNAAASNNTSFVWSTTDETYGSHDNGTFNVNPFNGIEGFYVGESNLYEHITSLIQPTEEDFITYYNTSFEDWPHEIDVSKYKNQFYELDEKSELPTSPFKLILPKAQKSKYVKLALYIHQSSDREFHYDIATNNIDGESYPRNKEWLIDESDNDTIWKFEFESFPSCEDWTLMRYIRHELPLVQPSKTTLYYSNEEVIKTNIIGEITSSTIPNKNNLIKLNIGNNVTSISRSTFKGCTNLTDVTISSNVTNLGYEAFSGCIALVNVTIFGNITNDWGLNGYYYPPFNDCQNLSTVTLGERMTKIGDNMFYNCRGLTNVAIGNSITSIGHNAFYDCRKLTSIFIPDSVTDISKSAFYVCESLTNVTIGAGVTNIGEYAFMGCNSIKDFSVADNNTVYQSKNGLLLIKDSKTVFYGVNGDVVIPSGVTSIGDSAFLDLQGLTSVTIPDSMISIGENAFYGCSSLTNVSLGTTVTSIGDYAFGYCSNLSNITCLATSAPSVESSTFGNRYSYAGYNSRGNNKLRIPQNSTGYNSGVWLDPLQNSSRCGFNIEFITE